jgi:hypothetical protein
MRVLKRPSRAGARARIRPQGVLLRLSSPSGHPVALLGLARLKSLPDCGTPGRRAGGAPNRGLWHPPAKKPFLDLAGQRWASPDESKRRCSASNCFDGCPSAQDEPRGELVRSSRLQPLGTRQAYRAGTASLCVYLRVSTPNASTLRTLLRATQPPDAESPARSNVAGGYPGLASRLKGRPQKKTWLRLVNDTEPRS